ncbi:Oxysterol-binding protein 4 [Mucor velutinosus]|uniref:Oxysterol-binding protein 4 n=1 Tax=Mucor velutinosus TaxID=708070 RepID=A0AAN7DMJ5_9FUNG|nr:Oxysterol-binding protein 4 [Mucor velutinosus]
MTIDSIPFEIAHCSSFDQDYKPESLAEPFQGDIQRISHRGWQTQKHPEYPQDLILRLNSGLCRIHKVEILSHHYKIASQIELYVGITKEQEQDAMYIQFTRLGFVNLDNNDRFQDRELKSIKIQADCEYIRLVMKGCYGNRLNIHKQVGILAINILGFPLQRQQQAQETLASAQSPAEATTVYPHHKIASQLQQSDEEEEEEDSRSSQIHNTNSHFDLEHWVQVIQNAEEDAAQDEDYKEAKLYKELGDRLTGLWRFLINLENDKQQAVATKDYDEADKIKADMIQVRQTAESLLKQSGIQITRDGDILPFDTIEYNSDLEQTYSQEEYEEGEESREEDVGFLHENTIPDLQSASIEKESKLTSAANTSTTNSNDQLLDEAIANWTSFDALSINHGDSATNSPSLLSARIPINDHHKQEEPAVTVPAPEPVVIVDPETIPEPLTADDLESCELAIDQFGEDLVANIMSVKVKCRQNGLNQLNALIASAHVEENQSKQTKKFIHASILMIQEAIMDSRESIFNQAIQSWKHVQDIVIKHMSKDDQQLYAWIEKFFTRLLMRTSDNNPGIKLSATKTILDLIEHYHSLVALCLGERMIRNMKDAKARIDLVSITTKKSLIPHQWPADAGAYRKQIMTFIVSYLNKHPHTEVRKAAWELLMLVAQYQQQRDASEFKKMCLFLNNDTIRLLEQELKKLNNKLKIKTSTSSSIQRALANNNTSSTKKSGASGRDDKRAASSKKTKSKQAQQQATIEEEDEKTNECIFCDEVNDSFNEDTLISHYYNQCPVLTNCHMCQIILEVSTLKDHLQIDCEKKHLVKQCTQCKQSIPVEQWKKHTLKKTCTATAENQSRCPFCQLDMTRSSEAQWKSHLINKCTKNPRKKLTK